MPYRVVAKYRNNEIKPFVFPNIIHQVCNGYNHAHTCISEVNDIGQQISDTLQYETEYDNLLMTTQRGRAGQVIRCFFFSGRHL